MRKKGVPKGKRVPRKDGEDTNAKYKEEDAKSLKR